MKTFSPEELRMVSDLIKGWLAELTNKPNADTNFEAQAIAVSYAVDIGLRILATLNYETQRAIVMRKFDLNNGIDNDLIKRFLARLPEILQHGETKNV